MLLLLDGAYSSRHLMSVGEQERSPMFSLASNVINLVLSFFILMLMVLRGNPRCSKSATITQCFKSQMNKAQKKIDRVTAIYVFCSSQIKFETQWMNRERRKNCTKFALI